MDKTGTGDIITRPINRVFMGRLIKGNALIARMFVYYCKPLPSKGTSAN
jgi:hypothetical protein